MKRFLLLVIFLLAVSASAQEFRATINGRVTDPSGAIVPKATILVTNTDTKITTKSTSNSAGEYTVPFLLPGKYSITVTAPGFTRAVHDGITLQTGDKINEDTVLAVGSVNEEVRVTADTPLIETATATMGQVLTADEIENLPDNGRSPLALAKLEMGVIGKQKNSVVQARPFDNSAASDFSIGGGNSQSNEYLLNGVPNMQDSSRVPGFSPSMDSVSEIRVDVFAADASSGDTSGGTVNLVTKAGTNTYHGTLSEFNEFSAMNAPNRWFVAPGFIAPATRQNQYGGTFGGPVRIPKLFNGRDKVFFFYSYEKFKDTTPDPQTNTVPTAAERTGDFSALLPLGSAYQLYDPTTGVLTAGKVSRTAFAGNKIPTNRISPVALAYLQYLPLPNIAGAADGENNFFSNVPTSNNYNSHAGRLDVAMNQNNRIFFEIHRSEYFRSQSNIFQNISTGTKTYTVHQGGQVDYIHTFTPSLTLDSRISLTRTYTNSTLPSQGFDATSLGFPSYINDLATERFLPRLTFSEPSGTKAYAGLSTTPGGLSAFDTVQFFTAVTKVTGHHSVKIGPDIRQNKYAKLTPGSSSSSYTFGNNFVNSGTSAAAIPFGSSVATFLLGLPTAGTQNIATPATYNTWYTGAFIQDDWRLRPSLTLNIGLRVEHETPITEAHNKAVIGWDPTLTNSATAGALTKYAASPIPELPVASFNPRGGVVYASSARNHEYDTATAYVSPRFGLAFAPPIFHNKMVMRAGFGLFVNPFNDFNTPQSYGFTATTALVPTTNGYLTPAATLADPFPTSLNAIQLPTGSALGVNTNLGAGVQFRGPQLHVPYSERWNFDIQQQLSRNIMIDVGYIGNHQVHLSYSNSISSVGLLPFLSKSTVRDTALTTNLNTLVTNPFFGQPGLTGTLATSATVSKATLLNSYPEYTGVVQGLVPGASATFHELLIRVQKRASHGLTFNANFEWSHNLSTGQPNQGGPQIYGENTSDYPVHLALEGSYKLPFGRGGAFLNRGRLADAVVGGFTVNTIYQYLSGTPISWGNVVFAGGAPYNGNLKISPRNYGAAFDKTLFDVVANDQPNSYNYRTFPLFYGRQDATNNVDMSILKDFHIWESVKVQYRFEAFNVLNHTQFGAPGLSPTASSFGTITSQANVPRTLQQGLRVTF